MAVNPFESPTQTTNPRFQPDVTLRVSYPVDRMTLIDSAYFYSVSRLELYGALAGVVLVFGIAVTSSILDRVQPDWWPGIVQSNATALALAATVCAIFAAGWFMRQRIFHSAMDMTNSTILDQIGTREITITASELTLQINGQRARWPMQQVRFLDRKSRMFRPRKHTILQLPPHLPLAIPDVGEFHNVSQTEFLKLLKRRCKNICLF